MLSFLPLKTLTGVIAGLLRIEDGVCTLSLRQPFSGECTLLLAGGAADALRSDVLVSVAGRTRPDDAARTAPRASAGGVTDTQRLQAVSIQPGAHVRVDTPVVAAVGTVHGAPAFFGAVDGCPFPLSDLLYRLSLQKTAAAEPNPSAVRSSNAAEPNPSFARSSDAAEPNPSAARSSDEDAPRGDSPSLSWEDANAVGGNRTPVSHVEDAHAADRNRAPESHLEDAHAADGNRTPVSRKEEADAADGNHAPVSCKEEADAADANRAPVSRKEEADAADANRAPAQHREVAETAVKNRVAAADVADHSATGCRSHTVEPPCDGTRVTVPDPRADGRNAQTRQESLRDPYDAAQTETASFAATLRRAERVYAAALCDPLGSCHDGDPRHGSADETGTPYAHRSLIAHARDTHADETGAPPTVCRCRKPAANRAAPSPWATEVDALLRDK